MFSFKKDNLKNIKIKDDGNKNIKIVVNTYTIRIRGFSWETINEKDNIIVTIYNIDNKKVGDIFNPTCIFISNE